MNKHTLNTTSSKLSYYDNLTKQACLAVDNTTIEKSNKEKGIRNNSGYFCNKMRKGFLIGFSLLMMAFLPTDFVQAQSDDDLYIFGFSQTLFYNRSLSVDLYPVPATNPVNGIPAESNLDFYTSNFALHQVNLFFQKSINDRTTFFLNLEASGSYSTLTPSGNLEIPEGWISYRFNDHLEMKAGLLLPKFNNLNEINNRLPLFPYLLRPLIYETLTSGLFAIEDWRPRQAYFQLSGATSLTSKLNIDYAVYVGNSEDSFLSPVPAGGSGDLEETSALYLGESLNTALAYGARVGVQDIFGNFKFGISGTLDEDNKTDPEQSATFKLDPNLTPVLGEIPRYRIGMDLSFNFRKFAFESEFIRVFHDHSELRRTPAFRNADLNKVFHYANLTYNITDKYHVFGFYSYSQENTYDFVLVDSPDAAGILGLSGGAGWKPNEKMIVKAQYMNAFNARSNPHVDYQITFYSVGVSVIF